MKKTFAFLTISLGIMLVACSKEAPQKVSALREERLFSHTSRKGDQYDWNVDEDLLKTQPQWHIGKEAPPLDINTAYLLAEKDVHRRYSDIEFLNAYLRYWPTGKQKRAYYYVFLFEVAAFEDEPVLVLMDKTIVQPTKVHERMER